MNRLFKYTLPALMLSLVAACSDDSTSSNGGSKVIDPNAGKELISFNGEGSGITRASLTRTGFTSQTKVVMRIKAEEATASSTPLAARYTKATATATANITSDTHIPLVGDHSDLNYADGTERYWDDAFGRNSKLTIWAFAIPNKTDATLPTWSDDGWAQVNATTNPNWYTDSNAEDVTVSWDVTTTQDATTMLTKDLTYSNNIRTDGTGGRYTHSYSTSTDWTTSMGNGPMVWVAKESGSTTGKFDQGHLIFNHALAKIEIRLKEGSGFDNTKSTDFVWTKNQTSEDVTQNITLKGLYTNGTFNVSTGTWTVTNANNISQMDETTGTTPAAQTTRTLWAYVLPGNNLLTTTSNVIEFEIDNAQYYVTGTQIANAIQNYYKTGGEGASAPNAEHYRNFSVTEQGKHYIIHLTVGKKSIDRITAAVIDWEDVNSEDIAAKNTYPTFDLEVRGTKLVEGDAGEFNIYRAAKTATNYILDDSEKDYTWVTGYTTGGVASKIWVGGTESIWKTGWNWPNNLTYYHFRATGIFNGTSSATDPQVNTPTSPATNDYFVIHSGTLTGSNYKDYLWGAPFKKLESGEKLSYSTTYGFDNEKTTGTGSEAVTTHQISQAIGATESIINMLMFHMTSQIIVNITTTTTDNKVTLKKSGDTDADKTKVEIVNFLPDGTVQMGDGLVTATGTRGDATMAYGTYTAEVAATTDTEAKAATYNEFKFGIVPQALSTGGQTIGLRITTPDGNQYLISDLSTITGTVSETNLANPYGTSGPYTINRWYPNYTYTYNITLKAKGIERITASVVPFETVTGDNIDITLEN